MHYRLLKHPKPNGKEYDGTDWKWLSEKVVKAARWLSYVLFDWIEDQRNAAPELFQRELYDPRPGIVTSPGFAIYLPDADDLKPRANLPGFVGTQPYHLVLVGEKSSLRGGGGERGVSKRVKEVREERKTWRFTHCISGGGDLGDRAYRQDRGRSVATSTGCRAGVRKPAGEGRSRRRDYVGARLRDDPHCGRARGDDLVVIAEKYQADWYLGAGRWARLLTATISETHVEHDGGRPVASA